MNKIQTLVVCLVALPLSALAKDIGNIPEIGRHQSIFVVEKNVNPENIAVVYTKVDEACRFVTDPANRDQPVFDFYWLMNRTSYKPMNGFFKSEFRKRMSFVAGHDATHFQLDANDLKEVKHDLGEKPRLDVFASASRGGCDVRAFMTLGPSDGGVRIRVDSIYGEGSSFPPSVDAVTLKGEVVDGAGNGTGKKVARRYSAR